jgi:2'-5' RNA ligase
MDDATQTAVIVDVPAAEDLVGAHRARWDSSAGWGVPAHVTVLYPFVPPDQVDQAVIRALAAAVERVPRFTATWRRSGWFGEEVLWLAPEPEEAFRALTTAVSQAFPDYPPYGGEFADVVPHLTVGDDGTAEELREAERLIVPQLPISMEVTSAALWRGTDRPGAWQPVALLPLGGRRGAGAP